MACKHLAITVGTSRVCSKCGATLLNNGKIYFDRELRNYLLNRKKGKKK